MEFFLSFLSFFFFSKKNNNNNKLFCLPNSHDFYILEFEFHGVKSCPFPHHNHNKYESNTYQIWSYK